MKTVTKRQLYREGAKRGMTKAHVNQAIKNHKRPKPLFKRSLVSQGVSIGIMENKNV